MKSVMLRFPGGKRKAVTLSYDDNVEADVKLVEIMKKYHLKGTFNINSGQFSPEGSSGDVLKCGHRRLTQNETLALHRDSGMEIACHGVSHPYWELMPSCGCVNEITEDRKELESLFGGIVRGMALPFGSYSDVVIHALHACGIAYARTTESTRKFDLPKQWIPLHPTCHHSDPKLMELAKKFVEDKTGWRPILFYLWGHSYEFDDHDSWHILEDFAQIVADREDIWYATNIEICDYVQAYKQLVFSADCKRVYNPTATELYIQTEGKVISIEPGKHIEI